MVTGFRFRLCDAFLSDDLSYDMIITQGQEKTTELNAKVDKDCLTVDITRKLPFIAHSLESINITAWNDKTFLPRNPSEGGYYWALDMTLDGNRIRCNGSNAFPEGFDAFLRCLHECGVPMAGFDKNLGYIKKNSTEKKEFEPWISDKLLYCTCKE